ncbi:MAG: peptidylprolyl isomerase, partial [Acidobacteriota bacterium]|nr:peptidylprolyl isomerase [Acidobacteriota bacterium]
MKKIISICFFTLLIFLANSFAQIPLQVLVSISKAEDELRFDKTLQDLMANKDAKIRARAALAAGRIGDEAAISALVNLLENDAATEVRTVAAFAVGEIESIKAADTILKVLKNTANPDSVRARATEAAGKIAAANAKDEKSKMLGEAILNVLEYENSRGKQQNCETVLLGLTAALRAKPEETNVVVAKFLTNLDARIRADAANTLSRIRAKNANEQFRAMLLSETDAVARANAARALGAAEDKDAFDILLNSALTDKDSRVRVSAIRSLGSLKDAKAADKLLERGEKLLANYKKSKLANPNEKSELLEIATTLGRILLNSDNQKATKFLDDFRFRDNYESPEIEIAFAQISPVSYLKAVPRSQNTGADFWKQGISVSQGMAEFSKLADKGQTINPAALPAKILLNFLIGADSLTRRTDVIRAIPDILRAFATFNPDDLPKILREHLKHKDIIVRATAAELLGDLEANKENISALNDAFPKTENDKLNDAALAILDALEKQYKKLPKGDESILSVLQQFKIALDSPDYLVRRKAIAFLKSSDLAGEIPASFQRARFPSANPKIGAPNKFRTVRADYVRAVSRKNGTVKAVLTTEKGVFTIDLTPEDAPLTVDNFIRLARSNYFNGLAIHRVVPNFVMQDGDPRGDGNGGPGWQIRCELNMLSYERGAVGMALSGKDTGGSQWFVTHAPQPHLDGGYTVFGRVNETDMKIVDNLVRGDKILTVKIIEGNALQIKTNSKQKPRIN